MSNTTPLIPYSKLPEDVREAIESTRVEEATRKITEHFKLQIDQGGKLYGIINSVLFGQTQPQSFVPLLEKELQLPQETILKIAQEANEQVFLAVRESLKKIHGVGPREKAPLERKGEVLSAIEAPESIPMRTRIVEASSVKPEPLPIIPPELSDPYPETPTPTPAVAQAQTIPPAAPVAPKEIPAAPKIEVPAPAPRPASITTPTPAAKTEVVPTPVVAEEKPAAPIAPKVSAPAPTAPKKPAPQPAPRAAGIDPYREATI